MILYVHTDLSGRYHYREADDSAIQPHLARLAWLLEDDDGDVLIERCDLIKPERGWTYDPEAITAHQIHPSMAHATGTKLIDALEKIGPQLRTEQLCAFNWDHHARVLLRSFHDIDCDTEIPGLGHPRAFCAMREATDHVRIPRERPGGGHKWPSMRDAYRHFAGEDLPKLANPIPQGRALVRAVRTIRHGIEKERLGT